MGIPNWSSPVPPKLLATQDPVLPKWKTTRTPFGLSKGREESNQGFPTKIMASITYPLNAPWVTHWRPESKVKSLLEKNNSSHLSSSHSRLLISVNDNPCNDNDLIRSCSQTATRYVFGDSDFWRVKNSVLPTEVNFVLGASKFAVFLVDPFRQKLQKIQHFRS